MAHRGFTLIELMIVIVILAIVASIALPNLLSARLSANEAAAIATMRELVGAEAQFHTRAVVDTDNDGTGEYGTLGEMCASVAVRGGGLMRPAVLGSAFHNMNASGEAVRSGYQYRLYLPDITGEGLGEQPGGGAPAGVDPDLAETTWCAYAWPTDNEQSGVRTFFVNQQGQVMFAISTLYSGPGNGPLPGAAFVMGGSATSITGRVAGGLTGRDGAFWRVAPN